MRTLKQNLKQLNKEQFTLLKQYSKHSNSLYNCTLYVCKVFFQQTGSYIGLSKLDKEMQLNFHYQSLPSFLAQEIVRLVDKNYRSFFALLKKKRNSEYSDNIKEPHFKKKGDFFILVFNNQRILKQSKDGQTHIKLLKNLKIKFNYQIGEIKQGIIKWNGFNFVLYLSYEQENETLKNDNQKYLGIDLGLNNFATCVSNVGQSFIINGRPLKSYNKFHNKMKSKIQADLEIKNKTKWSKKLSLVRNKRTRYIDNFMNNAVSYIVNRCKELGINTVVLGYNELWKQNINLGKKTNQSFTNIPHGLFRSKLESKCEREGLNLKLQEESYTSKCSFVDGEYPEKHAEYVGKRVKRGLFKTSGGLKVNADCNGASNIIVKSVGKVVSELIKEIGVSIVTPKVITL